MFVCVHVPEFPAEAVVRAEPELREHAVAVVEGAPPLVTVVACNERARAAGVEPCMTEMQAQERLRLACEPGRWQVKRRSPDQEDAAHFALLDCACAFSPRVEDTSLDTVIADISGLDQLLGNPVKIAHDLMARCSQVGLQARIAVAANADAAVHAARGYAGMTVIPAGDEAKRLGPLRLEVLLPTHYGKIKDKKQKLAAETAAQMLATLDRWGIRTLHQLAVLPEVAVVERLGQNGLQWQRYALGISQRELKLAEAPLKFEEVCELEYPVDLLEPLAFLLSRMLEQLCARLQSRALATHELRLKLQLDPHVTVDREGLPLELEPQITSREPRGVLERTLKLPVPMLDAKTFLKLLQLDLKANPPTAPILKLWLSAEPVRPRFDQHGLFLPLTPEPQKLEITLARLAGVVGGQGNVGAAEVLDTHRPDAFRMTRFAPPAPNYFASSFASSRPMSVLRRFRPPQPVSVLMMAGKPGTVGAPRSLAQADDISRTLYGEVVWCAGPWHISGEWWNQEPWQREEWDVAIGELNAGFVSRRSDESRNANQRARLYRLYRDVLAGTWFVEGEYD